MSAEHPIVAITGSSGAGSSAVVKAFEHIFWRERVKAVYVQGNAFHRYDRQKMAEEQLKAHEEHRPLSHFGPEGNHLDKLETLFFQYSSTGTGVRRYYLHSPEAAREWGQEPGTFTPWEEIDSDNDLLLYRGLHGAARIDDINIAQYPDLLLGIVPIVNLEWIRKISRDTSLRGYSSEAVRQSILDRMHDYVHYITPQFSRTHINIQMIPAVDTSNPFSDDESVPLDDECFLVVHFQRGPRPDFVHLLDKISDSYMSRPHTIVVPGSKLMQVLEIVLMPRIHDLITASRKIRNIENVPKRRGAGLLGVLGQSSK